jgi:hypothetical protein
LSANTDSNTPVSSKILSSYQVYTGISPYTEGEKESVLQDGSPQEFTSTPSICKCTLKLSPYTEGRCYGLSTRAYKSRILTEVSLKGNSKDDQQETLLVALINDNVKLARRP